MPAKGAFDAYHRRTGDALGYHGDVIKVKLRCHACSAVQSEMVDACISMRDATADVSCSTCGRAGLMRVVKT